MKQFFEQVNIFLKLKKEEIFDTRWIKNFLDFILRLIILLILVFGGWIGLIFLFSFLFGFTTEDGIYLITLLGYGFLIVCLPIICFKRWICSNWQIAKYILKNGGNRQCSNCGSNYGWNECCKIKPDGLCRSWIPRKGGK